MNAGWCDGVRLSTTTHDAGLISKIRLDSTHTTTIGLVASSGRCSVFNGVLHPAK